jgi:YidC/Oxa1 family membrane protein insertase
MVEAPSAELQRGVFLPPRVELSLDGKETALPYALSLEGDALVARAKDASTGVEVERVFKAGSSPYTFEVTLRLKNPSGRAVPYAVGALLRGAQKDSEAHGGFFAPPVHLFEGVCQTTDTLERQTLDKVASNHGSTDAADHPRFSNGVRWAGVDNRYFLTAFVPDAQGATSCEYLVGGEAARVGASQAAAGFQYLATRVGLPGGEVAAGQAVERTFTLYGGPKKHDALKSVEPGLDAAVDFGWLSTLALPMLKVLQWFYGVLPNWGVAIILLTILVKLFTLPLTVSQNRSMAAMKALAPEVEAIKKRHASEPMRANQEVMALYKVNGVNPLAGCLPMLLMMPVYFALYKTIYSAVELYHAELGGWITDLSVADPYYILPLVLGGAMFVQTRMTPSSGDPMQQKIMQTVMPVMFTGMMLFLPSGLVVYILVNTLLGILQQHYMNGLAAAAPKVEVVDGVGRRG